MNTAILQIHDEVNCSIKNLPAEIRRALYNENKIFNPANRFIPSVKMGRWDGKIPYFTMSGNTYINLLMPIIKFITSKNFNIELEDLRTYQRDFEFNFIDNNYVSDKRWPANHALAGQPIILRDHQTTAINIFLSELQGIACIPTGAGKSAITAILSKKVEKYGRTIVIVPNKDLIGQTEQYYHILDLDVGVYYGDRKDFFKTHTICTWQSLEKLRHSPMDLGNGELVTFNDFIRDVKAVIVDECHGIRGNLLHDMLTKEFSKIPIRWAVTGTIPKELHETINLTTSIGEVIHSLATEKLQDAGILSHCNIKIHQMIDTREFTNYAAEYDYLATDVDRTKFIAGMINNYSKSGNVLVLVGRKSTGKAIEKLLPNSVFISGDSKSIDRKTQYKNLNEGDNQILIATSQIASVGIDIPRINHLVMLESGKSFIRVIQSIGRALRTSFDKNHAVIHDICSSCKFSKRHLTNRKKFYNEQKFPFTMEKINYQSELNNEK
jgi:superfamily II DNA or RNA helicase